MGYTYSVSWDRGMNSFIDAHIWSYKCYEYHMIMLIIELCFDEYGTDIVTAYHPAYGNWLDFNLTPTRVLYPYRYLAKLCIQWIERTSFLSKLGGEMSHTLKAFEVSICILVKKSH